MRYFFRFSHVVKSAFSLAFLGGRVLSFSRYIRELGSIQKLAFTKIAQLFEALVYVVRGTLTKIPFNKPYATGKELQYIQDVIKKNFHQAGNGPFTQRCQQTLQEAIGSEKIIMTTSGTDALEMSSLLLQGNYGDEVILPSFTFVSTANAFMLSGYKPVLVDVRPDTLNIDETKIEEAITARTRAIVVMHYAGVSCEMDAIEAMAKKHKLFIIEDNAHGLFGTYKGRPLGSFGIAAAHSFHETKNFSCGEGGCLSINNPDFVQRAEIIRDKGTNRSLFLQGLVDKYSWVDIGGSYSLSEILAAFLWAQLQERETIQATRQAIWERYYTNLNTWAQQKGVQLPHVPEECGNAYHLFYMLLPTAEKRTRFIDLMREAHVSSVFHYTPLHSSEMGRKLGYEQNDCPIASDVSSRLVRLPFYNELDETTQNRVINTILNLPI